MRIAVPPFLGLYILFPSHSPFNIQFKQDLKKVYCSIAHIVLTANMASCLGILLICDHGLLLYLHGPTLRILKEKIVGQIFQF